MEFPRQQICRGGMTLIEAKLKAIQDWATPEDVKGVRSFVGFANYYRRFIQNFAAIVDPLTSLMRNDVEWQWRPYQRCAFKPLKGPPLPLHALPRQ